ncbi:type II toxin-antitoxin system VapC family toxin [Iamia sp.]|uniref:type II toxin-antitoxin system VapC family toxin n=1 Tax=Iamia sp. TaxID=2722710 RepID=UPI002C1733E5|nr:PIN domain-containing protein [Iamia sp.]HXH58744.1 PIN domain-containing protein [Iamia sp.]
MDAFDADALIYAASPENILGRRVRTLFPEGPIETGGDRVGVGSLLLLPEMLSKPHREGSTEELVALVGLLARLDLRPLDDATARLAVAIGAQHRLRAADAVHLATAIGAGANRFITNNRRDFPLAIEQIDITYPEHLPEP